MTEDREFITIVVPAYNEEAYIEGCIRSLVLDDDRYEIVVMDGGSQDRTPEIVRSLGEQGIPVKLETNPRRIQSAAVNIAAADTKARCFVRADAHCRYPKGFARNVVSTLRKMEAQSVVVPMVTVHEGGCFQAANAAAQNSALGNGGSIHRRKGSKPGWVDHGHHAGFDRDFFVSLGGYDEGFITNQDAEYDVRVGKAGGRVWLETSLAIEYFPRKTAKSLVRQYYRHGRGRAMTVIKHGGRLKARQMAPAAAFFACAASTAAAPFSPVAGMVPISYFIACLAIGAVLAAKTGQSGCALAMGVPASLMHLAWGCGFVLRTLRTNLMSVGGR